MSVVSGRRRAVVFVSLVAVLALPAVLFALLGPRGASAAGSQLAPVSPGSQLAQAGRLQFAQHCSTCHGPGGRGTGQGPDILGFGPADYDFQMSTGRMPLAQPGAQAIRKPTSLTRAQIDAIIAYLTSLEPGGTPIPDVNPATGDLSQGEGIYQLNCAPCHSSSGNGGAVGPEVAPGLHRATATQVAEAVRVGPGTMPVFGDRTITREQLNSLVRYVLYLRAPSSRGGLDLGLNGPVIEGFIALFIALGAIVLVSRYIGERS